MNLSLSKYFSFGYLKFLIPLFKSGIYRLDTFDDNKLRIITTNFYIDGDASTVLYYENEESDNLLVESNEDKVTEHLKIVEKKVGTMDVFYTQIQVFLGLIGSLITFLIARVDYGNLTAAGVTIGLGTFFILIRKYVLAAIIWSIKNLAIPLIQKNFF